MPPLSSPRVDFYILQGGQANSRALFTCKLTEKAFRLGHRVYIHLDNEAQCRIVDELLWSFRAGSFLPHARKGADAAPILFGCGEVEGDEGDILINLNPQVPTQYAAFSRIIEIVDQDEGVKAFSREHFRHFKQQGHPPETHQVTL